MKLMSLLWSQEGVLLCSMFLLVPVLVLGIVVVVAAVVVAAVVAVVVVLRQSAVSVFHAALALSAQPLSLLPWQLLLLLLPFCPSCSPSCHWCCCCHRCLICVDV